MLSNTFSRRYQKALQAHNASLGELLHLIPYLSLSWRKLFVSVCQYGQSLASLQSLHDEAVHLCATEDTEFQGRLLRYTDMDHFSEIIIQSTVIRSIIWMFLRTAPELGIKQSEDIAQQGFEKEFYASQTVWSDHQLFTYGELFRNPDPSQLAPRWLTAVDRVVRNLENMFVKHKVYFPTVNRTKNVSRDTGLQYVFHDPSRTIQSIRTVDLEVLAYKTGVRIGGVCEMRSAWKFNDLKPRLYYCTGGDQYWTSRYMKAFAVKVMESIPQTTGLRRKFPMEHLSTTLRHSDFVMYWDMTSFTTNLSELKYFLHWVARRMEHGHRGADKVAFFSYDTGITYLHPWELLDDYNNKANINPEFSIHRLLHEANVLGADPTEIYQQANNGMLGVHGNIGFSTALHGYHIGRLSHTDMSGVSIGDDALMHDPNNPEEYIKPTMQALGSIHDQKFGILPPLSHPSEAQVAKFMKRCMIRDENGLHLHHLFNIPISYFFDGFVPEGRTVIGDQSRYQRIKKVSGMIGALLWDINKHSHLVDDEDMEILTAFLMMGYRQLGLPYNGVLPGNLIHPVDTASEGTEPLKLTSALPSVQFFRYDPRNTDWAEYLFDSAAQPYLSLPCTIEGPGYRDYLDVGMTFYSPSEPLIRVLEDLGVLKTELVVETIATQGIENKRRFLEFLKASSVHVAITRMLVLCTVLCEPPSWYYDDFFRNPLFDLEGLDVE